MQEKELFKEMKIDCKMCFGLCCAALYFSASDGFPEDKEAGKPCINLKSDYTCCVHESLRSRGLKGCLGYDCFGAGQKVSQATFMGKGWKEFSESKDKMFEAFLIMRKLHEMKWYLTQAFCLQTNKSIKHEISLLLESMEQLTNMNADSLLSIDLDMKRNAVNKMLSTTSDIVRMKASKKLDRKSKRRIDYFGADLRKTNMAGADLRGGCLIAANLSGVNFNGADVIGADMRDANIKGADFSECIFLTQSQVNSAIGDFSTKLPFMIDRPSHWQK